MLCTVDVPRSTYTTQDICAWLSWFLNKKETERNIDSWAKSVRQKSPSIIEHVQQAPAWNSLKWLPLSSESEPPPLHLVLNVFIDWFNPMGNKQAGKKHSMGLIAFNCLNLPPNTRNLLSNYCIAGITPGTHEPTVTTINHVLSPIIDQLLSLDEGFRILTHLYPEGRMVQVKLLGLVGDVVATYKVAGYASHLASSFCSYCICTVKERPDLRLGGARLDSVVRMQARTYSEANMITKREGLVKKHGVRCSELNRLEYRDTVRHVVLGVMHNCLEGVLQHHWRYQWGFKGGKKARTVGEEQGIQDEEDDLVSDSLESVPDSWDSDFDLQHRTKETLFGEQERLDFINLLKDVVLPSGIDWVPLNLGDAQHGKLKAAQWKTLFVYVIPLIIPQLLVLDVDDFKKTSTRSLIVENIAKLCRCTQIVLAR